jgi:hypothetical protein
MLLLCTVQNNYAQGSSASCHPFKPWYALPHAPLKRTIAQVCVSLPLTALSAGANSSHGSPLPYSTGSSSRWCMPHPAAGLHAAVAASRKEPAGLCIR